jgi:restriction system protein
LKKYGLLENSSRGIRALTAQAKQVKEVNSQEVVRAVKALARKDGENKETENAGPPEVTQEDEWKQKLHGLLTQKLSPAGFERLVQRVLRESGFTRVASRAAVVIAIDLPVKMAIAAASDAKKVLARFLMDVGLPI